VVQKLHYPPPSCS